MCQIEYKITKCGKYRLGNDGSIFNIKFNRSQKLLTTNNGGYYHFTDVKKRTNKKMRALQSTILLHRLIALYFIGLIPNNFQVDHIDRNRLNNNVSNLRIVDSRINLSNRIISDNYYICAFNSLIDKYLGRYIDKNGVILFSILCDTLLLCFEYYKIKKKIA